MGPFFGTDYFWKTLFGEAELFRILRKRTSVVTLSRVVECALKLEGINQTPSHL